MRFLADENFDGRVINALRRRNPQVDILRVFEIGLSGTDDQEILEWAATEHRIILTHDVSTMVGFAYARVDRGDPMPGLIEVSAQLRIQEVVEDSLLLD
jgi:predicted nuclease of predicted toxin-antitoxin system